ncbi:MAG: hypothetical protein MZV49_03105 [Rhodopseudomonas palustris]|nr:hypothetical protein [Rhodopseudomonas palustris]
MLSPNDVLLAPRNTILAGAVMIKTPRRTGVDQGGVTLRGAREQSKPSSAARYAPCSARCIRHHLLRAIMSVAARIA